MSDDRFTPEQQEIDAAGRAFRQERCPGRQYRDGSTYECELRKGHVGDHRCAIVNGGNRYWWDVVRPEEIAEFTARLAPERKGT